MNKAVKQASLPGAEHRRYSFGQFVLDVDRGSLLLNGKDIPLRPKCFEVLSYLVEHPGVLISKDELLAAAWGDVVVTEDSLTQCLIKIRRALGDGSKTIVKTVPRRGYLFDVPVELHEPLAESSAPAVRQPVLQNRRPSRWSVGAASVLALAIVATWWSSRTLETGHAVIRPAASPNSIAVLPFADMSPGQDQEYFADGLSEEVLNLLAQIPELLVIARTSSFSFKGQQQDIETIARKLNVANILEGSVRKDGDTIRITAQLVSASNSAHLWSQTYDRKLENVFAVQSDIARSVAGFLKVKLLDEPPGLTSGGQNSLAYEAYLKAKFFYSRRGAGDNQRAIEHYQQALDIDPGLAEAWVGLAGSIGLQTMQQEIPWEEGWARSLAMVEKALALDPNNAEVHMRLANHYRSTSEQDKYQQHYERALQLGQSSALVQSIAAGFARRDGDMGLAIDFQRRAVALDPLGFVNTGNLGGYLYFAGHFTQAREVWLAAAALSPEHSNDINWLIGMSWIMQQQFGAARSVLRQLPPGAKRDQGMALIHFTRGEHTEFNAAIQRLTARNDFESAFYLTEIFSFQGELDKSFRWLQEATDRILETDPLMRDEDDLLKLKGCPFLAPMRKDARWAVWQSSTEARIIKNKT